VINGFKSFADPVTLRFGPGVTAVVGPNGSGKTNVADAVRWVLGEHNARVLRGLRLEDIIFSGSESRRAVGMAEVTMRLDNGDGALGVDFAEVVVSRRLYRSGESEFYINQTACRLRDIQELMAEAGLGRGLTVVNQSRIDDILSPRSEDRRALLEEAAGLVQHKFRKRQTLRRLEETEGRITRLSDIIAELERQLEPLAEQARRTQLYDQYRSEALALERTLLSRRLRRHETELDDLRRRAADLGGRLEESRAALEAHEQGLKRQRSLASETEERLAAADPEVEELAAAIQSRRSRLAVLEERRRAAAEERAGLSEEKTALRLRVIELGNMVRADREAAARVRSAAESAAAVGEREGEALQALVDGLRSDRRRLDGMKAELIEALNGEAEARHRLREATQEAEGLERRLDSLRQQERRLEARGGELEARLAHEEGECAAQRRAVEAAREALEAAERDCAAAEGRLARARRARTRLQELLAGAGSRLRLLEEMIAGHEGLSDASRWLLGREDGRGDAVRGSLVERLWVEQGHERPVEAALGHLLHAVGVADRSAAEELTGIISRESPGRVGLLPLDDTVGVELDEATVAACRRSGAVGSLADLVRADADWASAVRAALGGYVLCPDDAVARRVVGLLPAGAAAVTPAGDVRVAHGPLMLGGEQAPATGLLGRRRERAELQGRVARLEQAAARAARRVEALESARTAEAAGRTRAESCLHAAGRELEQAQSRLEAITAAQTEVRQGREDLARTTSRARRDLETRGEAVSRLAEQLDGLRSSRRGFEEGIAELDAALGDAAEREQAARDRLEEARRRRAEAEQGLAAVGQRLELQVRNRRELALNLRRLRRRLSALADRERGLEQEFGELEAGLGELCDRHEELSARARRLRAEARQQAEAAASYESRIRGERSRQGQWQSRLHDLEVRAARLEAERDTLRERLEALKAGAAGEGRPDTTPTESVADGDDFDPAAAEDRLGDLHRRLESLGPVNPAAVEEYAGMRERHEFLQRQRLDLEEGRKSLLAIIDRVDRRMQDLFLETFNQARAEFRQVFRRLFRGGKADLRLSDPENVLETGVDILAQPPGKKLVGLSMLSGGERALVAIALLFALLRVRPGPFYVFDEVEAALDDANVTRFGRFLKENVQGTQFVVITHKKGTMETADVLYGMSMRADGVSGLVSVRLGERAG